LGLVVCTTSVKSVSLQKVCKDILSVFNDEGSSIGVNKTNLVLGADINPKNYEGADLTIVTMVFDPMYIPPYAGIVRLLHTQNQSAVLYSSVEGKPIPNIADYWIKRDLSVIANSEYTKERLTEFGMRVDEIIYHGVNVKKIQQFKTSRKGMRRTLGVKDDDFVVGYIAGCYPRKGHLEYANVIKEVEKHDKSIKFVVLTQLECSEAYNDIADVILMNDFGTLDEETIFQIYHAFDVYVQPSLAEGFGLPVLEALAAGLPVVHTNYKPLSEITDEKTSFRVPVDYTLFKKDKSAINYEMHYYDPTLFAEAIIQAKEAILKDRDGFQQKAVERATEFDIHKVYKRFIELYKRGKVNHV